MSDTHVGRWASKPKPEPRELAAGVLRGELSGRADTSRIGPYSIQTAFSRRQRAVSIEAKMEIHETDSMKGVL